MSNNDKKHYLYVVAVILVGLSLFQRANLQEQKKIGNMIDTAVMESVKAELKSEIEAEIKLELDDGRLASQVQIEQVLRVIGSFITRSETCFVLCDRNGKVTHLNDMSTLHLNLELGDGIDKCVPEEYRERHKESLKKSFKTIDSGVSSLTDVKAKVITKDGSLVVSRIQAFPWSGGAGAFITIQETQKE